MTSRNSSRLVRVPGGSFRLIKPLIGYQADIVQQLRKFPFEKNVFLMMRFRKENKPLSDFIIRQLAAAGLNCVRADQPQWNLTGNVYNPIAVLYCCKYGIALFDEAEKDQAYNPNVIYELGMMHTLERECLILRNDTLPPIPFDLIKDIYMPYKGKVALRTNIQLWLQQIKPETVKAPLAAGPTPESRLEFAAFSARKENKDLVIEAPEKISATDLDWQILSKDKENSTLAWTISLTNTGQRPVKIQVHVLFLDKDGFALDDDTGLPLSLPPRETCQYEAATELSNDLAGRTQRAVATVSRVR